MTIKCRKIAFNLLLISMLVLARGVGFAQQSDWQGKRGAARFAALDWLIGEWRGYGKVNNRTNYIRKQFYYDLDGMYLIERTTDMFPPEKPTTDYETHQDFTVYYREIQTGTLKAKGFFVESFVTSSRVTVNKDGASIVVESDRVENGPAGMRSRFTILRQGDKGFIATFELAMPGKDYAVIGQIVMARVN